MIQPLTPVQPIEAYNDHKRRFLRYHGKKRPKDTDTVEISEEAMTLYLSSIEGGTYDH